MRISPRTCFAAGKAQIARVARDQLRYAHIPSPVRNDIVAAIAKDFVEQPKEFPAGGKIALSSRVSFIQLTPVGKKAIVVTGGPDDPDNGATGNGDIWLFRRMGNRAVLILRGGGFGFRATGKIYHNGMLDIQTAWNMSCCDGGIEVYRFDGKRYEGAYCFSYRTDDDGNMTYGPRAPCNNSRLQAVMHPTRR